MLPNGYYYEGNVILFNKSDIVNIYNDGCYGSSASSCSLKPLFMRKNKRRFRDLKNNADWVEPWKLNLLEAYYLISNEKIQIVSFQSPEKVYTSAECWQMFSNSRQFKNVEQFACLYSSYNALKKQGWVVKLGQTYGCHFTVYLGDPDTYHSQFCVLVKNFDSEILSWGDLTREMRVSNQTAKDTILCEVQLLDDPTHEACDSKVDFAIMLRWALKHDEVGKERKPHAKLAKKLTQPVTKTKI